MFSKVVAFPHPFKKGGSLVIPEKQVVGLLGEERGGWVPTICPNI